MVEFNKIAVAEILDCIRSVSSDAGDPDIASMLEEISDYLSDFALGGRLLIAMCASGLNTTQIVTYSNVDADHIDQIGNHCHELDDLECDTRLRMLCKVLPLPFEFVATGKVELLADANIIAGGIRRIIGDNNFRLVT